jgi:hypothetical protein
VLSYLTDIAGPDSGAAASAAKFQARIAPIGWAIRTTFLKQRTALQGTEN